MPPENARSSGRYVTDSPEPTRSRPERWTHTEERDDPEQRFFLYRLCPCDNCQGKGRYFGTGVKCEICRGEGRTLDLVATAPTPEAIGVALVQLGREGEFDECPPIGLLDTQGEVGQKWLVSPWKASPREVSQAGRVLRASQTTKGKGNT